MSVCWMVEYDKDKKTGKSLNMLPECTVIGARA